MLAFVADLAVPVLDEDDRRHLERSLRLRPGTEISVGDGVGRWRPVALGPDLAPLGPVVHAPKPRPRLVVGFAPVKGDRAELVVQKLTELGVDVIAALATERSVVRWDDARRAKNAQRFARIAREAAMQSRNPWLPEVESQQSLSAFFSRWPSAVLADPDGDRGLSELTSGSSEAGGSGESGVLAVAIGPEGGFDPRELEGRSALRLPGRILRTETAAITAGAVLATLRSGFGRLGGENSPS